MYMIQNKIKFGFTLTYTCLIMNKNIKYMCTLHVEDFDKIRKNDVTLRSDNTIFEVIIAPTLNEF
jgi:hypothetical protein